MSGSATSEHRLSLVKNPRIGNRSVQGNLILGIEMGRLSLRHTDRAAKLYTHKHLFLLALICFLTVLFLSSSCHIFCLLFILSSCCRGEFLFSGSRDHL